MIREVFKREDVGIAEYVFYRDFMAQNHNYLCAVCRERSAVIETWHGILQPCWDCQRRGYKLIKFNWLQKLFLKWKITITLLTKEDASKLKDGLI